MSQEFSDAGTWRIAPHWKTLQMVCWASCCFGIAFGLTGCGTEQEDDQEATANSIDAVYVDNYPMFYFASRIGGEDVDVRFPLPSDIDPAFWEPDMDEIREYQQARLLLFNGADYAKWAEHVSLPDRSIVRTADAFRNQWITVADAVAHRHGPEGESHKHDGIAFTTWLDPQLAELQAEAAFEAMAKTWPEHRQAMKTRWQALRSDLKQLDQSLTEANVPYQHQPLIASHPVYQYLARRLDWNLQNRHWEPDQVPSDEEWAAFDELLKEHPAEIMIWEGQPTEETRMRLADRGVTCIVYVPCGNRPKSGDDFLSVMKANVTAWNNAAQQLAAP